MGAYAFDLLFFLTFAQLFLDRLPPKKNFKI